MYEETLEGKLSLKEKKRISQDRRPECEWYPHELKIYNENRDNLDLMRKQLYELTVGMYEDFDIVHGVKPPIQVFSNAVYPQGIRLCILET